MGAADELAALKNPTPAQIVDIYERNGIPLVEKDGRFVAPGGITPDMAAQLARHEAALVAHIRHKKDKPEKPTKKDKQDGSEQ